jgi:long-subunit fatty acid transport protein
MDNPTGKEQFTRIEESLGTTLTVPQKEQMKLWEFPEILEIARQESESKGLTVQQWYRWIAWKQLKFSNKIKVEIESYKPQYLTAEDLGMTEEACNIAMRKIDYYRA